MREKTIKIYTFGELSAKAKEHARNEAMADMGYPWSEDALASLKALAEHFGGKLVDWSIDWFDGSYSSAQFAMPDEDEMSAEEIARRLGNLGSYNAETLRGNGDCILTGYMADEDAIDGLRRAFVKGERDLGRLMQAAFRSWLKAAQADCEHQYSDDVFGEMCDANNYEFLANGDMA